MPSGVSSKDSPGPLGDASRKEQGVIAKETTKVGDPLVRNKVVVEKIRRYNERRNHQVSVGPRRLTLTGEGSGATPGNRLLRTSRYR